MAPPFMHSQCMFNVPYAFIIPIPYGPFNNIQCRIYIEYVLLQYILNNIPTSLMTWSLHLSLPCNANLQE